MARTSGSKNESDYTLAIAADSTLVLRSKFGLAAGVPYFDAAGAAAGEDALLTIDPTSGALSLKLAALDI